MNRRTIPTGAFSIACVALSAGGVFASSVPRVMMHPDSDRLMHNSAKSTARSAEKLPEVGVSMTRSELVEMRGLGIDLELIDSSKRIPDLSISGFGDEGRIDPDAIGRLSSASDGRLSPSDNMLFTVGRSTTLSDGNIAGSTVSLPGEGDAVPTMTQSEGEYNFYEMAVEWRAASNGAVDFSLISGVTAIEANVAKRVQSDGGSQLHDVTHRVVAVPTIGSSLRWNISRDWSLTGQATTQSLNIGSSLVGFNAQSDWRISDRVGLVAGYQILRSEFDLGAVTTDLNQEGLFARLSIKF